MKRMNPIPLLILVCWTGFAFAQEGKPPPPETTPKAAQAGTVGRFAFYSARAQGGLEYLLDTTTGDLWVISRDPDTNYVYLGYIPKGPAFTFEDILRQKQIKKIPAQQ